MSRSALRVRALLAACALGACALDACSIDPGANQAFGCEGCAGSCVMGFCLQREQDGGLLGGGAGDGGPGSDDGGTPVPEACDEPGGSEFCYEGPADTATSGACKAGMRVCGGDTWSVCLGQVLPGAEQCNRADDDCDGSVDEDVELGTCSTGQLGECEIGMLRCEAGIAVCARATDPSAEQCNGRDDDCDDELDEELSPVCYPAASAGCDDDGVGGFTCMGLCVPGVASCVEGEPQACAGQVEPVSEACTSGGPAQDEDCDGQADNGCTCAAGDSQDCYGGPPDTLGVGACDAGTQDCDPSTSTYGACMGEVLPAIESCDNQGADDDCNGTDDDVRGHAEPCTIEDQKGVCRDGWQECKDGTLQCLGPEPSDEACNGFDDDCDGGIDEGLLEDDANCGECGHACDTGTGCCSGACVDIKVDPLNCGRCDNPCGAGLECCSGNCVNLEADKLNCNTCGRECTGTACCVKGACSMLAICM